LVALLVYANSLGNGLVWDDPIVLSRQLVVFRSAGDVLLPPRGIPQFSPDYYRPLTVASYLLDRALGGGGPFAYHLSVVLAHAIAAALVCVFAGQLLGTATAATFGAVLAGLLFAVHPIHTESVAWAAGRSDVFATCFLVAALVVHRSGRWSWRRSAATGVFAAASLGAKENAVALYPLLLLSDVLVPPPDVRRRLRPSDWLRRYAGPLAAATVYVVLRRAALGEFIGSVPGESPTSVEPGTLLAAIGVYAGKLVWPLSLNPYIDHLPSGVALQVAVIAMLLSALAAALWWWRAGHLVPLFALLWMALTLAPSLTILWKIPDTPVAERYLYLPSVGLCLMIGYGAMRAWSAWPDRRRVALAASGAAVILLGARATIRRNSVWHDDVALWEDAATKSHRSGMPLRSLGAAYQKRGRLAEARRAFEDALEKRNSPRGLQTVLNNLGTLAMGDHDYAAAQRYYEEALRANPQGPDTLFNLGLAILYRGKRSRDAAHEALDYFLRARELSGLDGDIEAALGQAYMIIGDERRAATHLRRALDLGVAPVTAESVKASLAGIESPADDATSREARPAGAERGSAP
jgi:tetratricopeptide (TPR) repeat protein